MWPAITKYHRLSGFHGQAFIPLISGGWEVPDQGVGRFCFLVEIPFLVCRWPPSHCVFTRQRGEVLVSLLRKALIPS